MLTAKQSQEPRETHPREQRVRFRAHFLRIQKEARRVHTPHFVVLLSPSDRRRLGVTVTRKVAGAVGRNRIRRLCREVFRRNQALFPADCDVVMVARQGAELLGYAEVCEELTAAGRALGRLAHKLGRMPPAACEEGR